MKRMYNLLTVAFVLLATIATAQQVEVTNGGFEEGLETGWGFDITAADGAVGEFVEEVDDVKEGEKALKIFIDELGANDWSQQFKNETWTVESGKSYKLTMWAKDVSTVETDTVKISFTAGMTNAVDTWHEGTRLDYEPLNKEWTMYAIYFTPAAEDVDADLFAYQSTHLVAPGACIVDDFQVEETQNMGAEVAEDGSLIVSFVEVMADPAGNEGNFEVTVGGVANVVTALVLDEIDLNKVVLTMTDAVAADAEVVITYTPGTLVTSAGTEITEFTITLGSEGGDPGVSVFNKKATNLVSVYPNPAQNVVYFDVDNAQSVDVYDITGKNVKSVKSNVSSVDVSELNSGVYFIMVKDLNGKVFTNRVIKE